MRDGSASRPADAPIRKADGIRSTTNLLLSRLEPADLDLLAPHLEAVELPFREVLQLPDRPIEHAYFLENGFVSVLTWAGRERIEVGLVGREGMVGLPLLHGLRSAPFELLVQSPCRALRIGADDLERVLAIGPGLRATLGLFSQAMLNQTAQTALANGRCTVEQRLARWLLMAQDRLASDEITLTHEVLALMLGVRRPGVTVALHMLEGGRAIRSRRNSIRITDRAKLEAVAGAFYGIPEAYHARLFGSGGAPAA